MMYNKNKIAIHQPSYFPWLGYIEKLTNCDRFVLLDEVQLADRAYQHRNIFLTKEGKVKYLTVSIDKKNYRNKKIKEIHISDDSWQKKHYNFITENYKKHDFFDEIFPEIEFIFFKKYKFLLDVLLDSMSVIYKFFNIDCEKIKQSEILYNKKSVKDDLIIDIVKHMNGNIYVSGRGIMNYSNEERFKKNKILLEIIKYKNFNYYQKNTEQFIAGLSSLDLLFNCGIENSKRFFFDE